MFVYNESSTRRVYSAWGIAVKKRLLEKNIRQDEVVKSLNDKGFNMSKGHFSNLLYGIGTTTRTEEIAAINRMLDIPFED